MAEKEARRKRNKKEVQKLKSSSKGFSSLFCMSGNSDTLERMPMPARKPGDRSAKKPVKIGGSVADKVVKRNGKKPQNRKFRHSAPIDGYLSVMSNGIEDEVAKINEAAAQGVGPRRDSASSPVGYRFDGTLQRPYVFPGGLTFIAGRKNGKTYAISPDKVDPVEKAKTNVPVDVHQWSMSSEMPVYHDGKTSWIARSEPSSAWSSDEDVRKQFTLKYDDRVPYTGETDDWSSLGRQADAACFPTSSSADNLSTCANDGSEANDPPNGFPLRKGVSLEILNTNSSQDSEKPGKGRYSLPQRDSSCVYMGSFENLTLLTLKRNANAHAAKESDYFKSKQKMFNTGRKNHYSLPTLNHDFVCMGSFDDINVQLTQDADVSDSEDDGASPFQRMGRGRCSMSLPDLSQKLEYTLFDLPPVLSDSDGSSSDMEDDGDGTENHQEDHDEKSLSPSKPSPTKCQEPLFSSPFSRNLGRASCMPGNKRFFIPPPPCFTPPKDEMETVQSALSKLSCHKGSQVDITGEGLDLDMEDRDQSLKRCTDVKRLSSSLTDLTQCNALSLPGSGHGGITAMVGVDTETHVEAGTGEARSCNASDRLLGDEQSHSVSTGKALLPSVSIDANPQTDVSICSNGHVHDAHPDQLVSQKKSDQTSTKGNVNPSIQQSKGSSPNTQTVRNVEQSSKGEDTCIENSKSRHSDTMATPPSLATPAAVTSTPKSFRKMTTPSNDSNPSPSPSPRPIPRQRSSLAKTQSMCLGSKEQHSLSIKDNTVRPVPRKRLSLAPRPQSEIIETESFSDYLDKQTHLVQNTMAVSPLASICEPHVPSTNSHMNSSLAPISEPCDLGTDARQPAVLEPENVKTSTILDNTTQNSSAPKDEHALEKNSTVHSVKESRFIKHASKVHGGKSHETKPVGTTDVSCDTEPSRCCKDDQTQKLSSHRGRDANRLGGCRLATPGPIISHRSYKLAVHNKLDVELDDEWTMAKHTDSSNSNDEDVDVIHRMANDSLAQDEDHCAADDEMSMGEEDTPCKRGAGKDVLRSGSILDRSLIIAHKHRQRMRERKCVSQIFSSTETDDPDCAPSSLNHVRSNSGNGKSTPYKAVTFVTAPAELDQNNVNKSMDSGTFSDYNISPTPSPDAHTCGVTFAGGDQNDSQNSRNLAPRHAKTRDLISSPDGQTARVSFAGGEHKDLEDRDQAFSQTGVKRQISVQKKSWEVRLRRKHWMRKTGSRDNGNTQSWHCGGEGEEESARPPSAYL